MSDRTLSHGAGDIWNLVNMLTCPGDLNSNGDRRDQANLSQYKLLQLSEEVELQRV